MDKKKEIFDMLWKALSESKQVEHYETNWDSEGFVDSHIRFYDGDEITVDSTMTIDGMIQRANEMLEFRKEKYLSK